MPVTTKSSLSSMGGCSCGGGCGHGSLAKRVFWVLMCALLIAGVYLLATMNDFLRSKTMQVGRGELPAPTITVNGMGKVSGKNDIAMTTIGFSNIDKDVATAQANNDKVMSQVMKDLKGLGIAERDLTTGYSISAQYDYPAEKSPQLRGYEVSQSVAVKIRDLNKISAVLALAGKYGANEVGGLSFTIDDAEKMRAEARGKALEDAKIKAYKLADNLGMRLVEIVAYNEYQGGGDDYYMFKNYPSAAGALMEKSAPISPVSSGSTDVEMNVSITYAVVPR